MKSNKNISELFTAIREPVAEWLRGRWYEFCLPTEIVVVRPQIVTPKVGRFYEVDLYVRGRNLIPYNQLRIRRDFSGTSRETQVYLYEIWSDCGSDGHTEYKFKCWMLHPGIYDGDPLQIYEKFYDQLEGT